MTYSILGIENQSIRAGQNGGQKLVTTSGFFELWLIDDFLKIPFLGKKWYHFQNFEGKKT